MPYGKSQMRGDYGRRRPSRMRGDPGFFDFLKKGVRTIAGVAGQVLPGPFGVPGRIVSGALNGGGMRMPGVQEIGARVGTYETKGVEGAVKIRKDGKPYKRPRMNVANPKALRRAIRREQGFVKLARRALKGTGYVVARRGASRARPRVTVRESGPGSVSVR